jgi:hypothetical protein
VLEHLFDYSRLMTWTPEADGEPGGADALPFLVDPGAQAAVAGLNASMEALVGCEPWRLPDEDLAALVQVSEVAHRRLLMVQVAAAVEAGKRGLPRQAGFGPGRVFTAGTPPRWARGCARWST